ncbi:hypothetical protein [Pontibacter harenae]|uniref:hypothetical protein n=1 Tax=Pontibacter harenae TaxID=2894083 RepID=UPI001E34DC85|nr:hypothetical protein [Pontibacter harenae]MCC9168344.1 hypothetical protein [Pontibacter harenae]
MKGTDMSDNKDQNKERLQKQSEHQATGLTENKRQQKGFTDDMSIDPAQHTQQTNKTKVQNPTRNLAKGGNNTDVKYKSGS